MRLRIILLLLFFASVSKAQNSADEILGYYMSPGLNSIFKFYKEGNKYFAKPVWMRYPDRLDTLNPIVNNRKRKILGSVLVWDFVHDGPNTWVHGYVYDANSGKTYKARIERDEKGNLLLRGYIGIELIGRNEYFVKVNFKE